MPVDISTALDLKINHNLSYAKIATIQGVTPNAIFKRIKHLLPDEFTEHYQANRADILSHLQVKLLSQVDAARLKRLSARDAAVAFGILYDKERLERGQSTANVEMHTLSQREVELQARLDQLKQAKLSTGSQKLQTEVKAE